MFINPKTAGTILLHFITLCNDKMAITHFGKYFAHAHTEVSNLSTMSFTRRTTAERIFITFCFLEYLASHDAISKAALFVRDYFHKPVSNADYETVSRYVREDNDPRFRASIERCRNLHV